MNPAIKLFIEYAVDILDTDPVDFFFKAWQSSNSLRREDVAYMSTMLSEAGIKDVEENRRLALLKALDTEIEEFTSDDPSTSSMPVYDFIEAYMENCVGYDKDYVLLFIQKHAERWDNYIELYKENNMPIISRR